MSDEDKKDPVLGEIRFKSSDSVVRKYAILVNDVDFFQELKNILTDDWELENPKLLFSIFGSAGDFQMSESLKHAFGRGLMKAARSTGAWILTQGIDTGVSKHVGEAICDHRLSSVSISSNPIVTIGIANYNTVYLGHPPSYVTQSIQRYAVAYSRENQSAQDEDIKYLDPNHTHFILVDNYSVDSFDISRYRIQTIISTIGQNNFSSELETVPIVYILVCGDMDTFREILPATKDGIPVLVISGSGNLADVLAFAYQAVISRDGHTYAIEEDAFQEMVGLLTNIPGVNEHSVIGDARMIEKVVTTYFQLFTVYNLHFADNKISDIDESILRALLKANVQSLEEDDFLVYQLHCALAFGNCKVARNEVFSEDKQCSRMGLDMVAHHAVLEGKADFMELLLDKGHSAREFVTQKRLIYFYRQTQQQLFNSLLQKVKTASTPVTLKHIGHLIQYLMGDFYQPSYLDQYTVLDMDYSIQNEEFETLRLESLRASDHTGEPFKHLFLWGILTGRLEMARVFWKHGKDKIAAALVAYGLLSSLAHKTSDGEEKQNLLKYAQLFSDLAVAVLNECCKIKLQYALKIMSQNVRNWGNISCLELAVGTCNKHFISQMACQSLLKANWMGDLSTENSTMRIITCVAVPPAGALFIKYKALRTCAVMERIEEDVDAENDEQEEPLRGGYVDFSKQSQPNYMSEKTQGASRRVKFEADRKPDSRTITSRKTRVPLCSKCYKFYTAPVIVFVHNVLSYILFLTLYSYVLLVDFRKEISTLDIVLFIWVSTLCLEEVRQMVSTRSVSLVSKLRRYIKDIWNILDVITITLFVCGTIVRFLPYANTLDAARVILGINLITFFIRLLHIFSVHRKMGPKIVMIGRMFQDLLYFLVILFLFLAAYAIAAYSILFPNSSLDGHLMMNIFKAAYWNLFGELFLEDLDKKHPDCTNDPSLYQNNTLPRCPAELGVYAGPILTGVYVLFCNILLLNLVIAMFSFTFQKIHDNTDLHWHYQQSILISEYCSRPPLPPPFIVVNHIILAFQWLAQKCFCRRKSYLFTESDDKDAFHQKLRGWENSIAHSYLQRLEAKENESVINRVSQIYERTERLSNQMDFTLERLFDIVYLLQQRLPSSTKDDKTPSDHVISRLRHSSDRHSDTRNLYQRNERSCQKTLERTSTEHFVANAGQEYIYDKNTDSYRLLETKKQHIGSESIHKSPVGSSEDIVTQVAVSQRKLRSSLGAIVDKDYRHVQAVSPPTSLNGRQLSPLRRSRSLDEISMENVVVNTRPSIPVHHEPTKRQAVVQSPARKVQLYSTRSEDEVFPPSPLFQRFEHARVGRQQITKPTEQKSPLEESIANYEHKLRAWGEMQRENLIQREQTELISVMVKELNFRMQMLSKQVENVDLNVSMLGRPKNTSGHR